eukprot:c15159_g1_i1.p1 GENE.c15159_g1_i1~~c15159_g1_i1.p1  ORF type:complete len:119 (+),score=13.90 c15159_g1_i1:34-390(+)
MQCPDRQGHIFKAPIADVECCGYLKVLENGHPEEPMPYWGELRGTRLHLETSHKKVKEIDLKHCDAVRLRPNEHTSTDSADFTIEMELTHQKMGLICDDVDQAQEWLVKISQALMHEL